MHYFGITLWRTLCYNSRHGHSPQEELVMKKLIMVLMALLVCTAAFAALDFTEVDELYLTDEHDQEVYDKLSIMLDQATEGEEKANVLWRLSRVCVDLGDAIDKSDKKARFAIYEEGEQYAIDSIATYPTPEGYLWKCSNIGRWGQTKGVFDSLAKAKPMVQDLEVMIDDLGCLDSSEAWYVLAVLYDSLPRKPISFGNSNAAISYGRIACDTIPRNVIYGGTYKQLAEMLWNRNWNAKKRASEISKMQKNWDKETSNIEKYKYYEGANGAQAYPLWTKTALSSMTDRQEAVVILKYAQAVFEGRKTHTQADVDNYNEIAALLNEWT